MKFKKIILITLLLLTVLTISSVSATDNNATNEQISLENNMQNNFTDSQYNQDNLQISDDNSTDNVNVLKSSTNNNSSSCISTQKEDNLPLSASIQNDDLPLSASIQNNNSLLKSSFLTYNYYDDYEYGMVKTEFDMDRNLKVNYKSNSHFEVYLYPKGTYYPIEDAKIILKVWTGKKVKQYNLRTNKDGLVKFNTKKLKVGKHKVQVIYNGDMYEYFGCKATTKIIVKKTKITKKTTTKKTTKKTKTKKKSKYKSVTLKLKVDTTAYSMKKLKTGDVLLAVANSYERQHSKGVTIGTMIDAGQEGQHSTKLIKAKVWFKNIYTGKIKVKTQYPNKKKNNIKKVSWINDYIPYKAKVWYKHR